MLEVASSKLGLELEEVFVGAEAVEEITERWIVDGQACYMPKSDGLVVCDMRSLATHRCHYSAVHEMKKTRTARI